MSGRGMFESNLECIAVIGAGFLALVAYALAVERLIIKIQEKLKGK